MKVVEKIKDLLKHKKAIKIALTCFAYVCFMASSITFYYLKESKIQAYSSEVVSFTHILKESKKTSYDNYFKSPDFKEDILELLLHDGKYDLKDLDQLTYVWGESSHTYLSFHYSNYDGNKVLNVLSKTKIVVSAKLDASSEKGYVYDFDEKAIFYISTSKNNYSLIFTIVSLGIMFCLIALYGDDFIPKFETIDFKQIRESSDKC